MMLKAARFLALLSAIGAFVLMSTFPAYAYIDPGSASIALQAIIAVIAGAAAFIGMYYRKVKDFLFRSREPNDKVKDSCADDS